MLKDFHRFYVKQQKQFNEMNKILEKVNKELEEGLCSPEQRDNFQRYYDTIKANYDRLSYVKHLLLLPPDFIQKIQWNKSKREYEKQQREMYKQLKADEEAILAENEVALQGMRDGLNSEGDKNE